MGRKEVFQTLLVGLNSVALKERSIHLKYLKWKNDCKVQFKKVIDGFIKSLQSNPLQFLTKEITKQIKNYFADFFLSRENLDCSRFTRLELYLMKPGEIRNKGTNQTMYLTPEETNLRIVAQNHINREYSRFIELIKTRFNKPSNTPATTAPILPSKDGNPSPPSKRKATTPPTPTTGREGAKKGKKKVVPSPTTTTSPPPPPRMYWSFDTKSMPGSATVKSEVAIPKELKTRTKLSKEELPSICQVMNSYWLALLSMISALVDTKQSVLPSTGLIKTIRDALLEVQGNTAI